MAKKQTVKAQKKKTSQKKSRNQGRNSMSTMTAGPDLVKMVCSNINPFCSEAKGAKLYDSNSLSSLTYQSRQTVPIVTDANGKAYWYFSGNAIRIATAATIVASVTTAWGAYSQSPFYSAFSSQIGSYRIVSYGLKWKTTQAWTTAQGIVIVTEVTDQVPLTVGQNITLLSYGLEADLLSLRDAEFQLVGKPQGMNATDYILASSVTAPPYSGFTIAVDGATASTTVATVEIVVNYEWTVVTNSGFGLFASPAAESIPAIMDARSGAAAGRPLIERFTNAITADHSWMESAANNLRRVASLGSAVANFFPMGRAAKGLRALEGVGHRLMLGN